MFGTIEIRWRRLRLSLAACTAAALAGGAAAAATWWHESRIAGRVEAAEIRLAEARGRHSTLAGERRKWQRFGPLYRRLAASGRLGEEQPERWAEAVRSAAAGIVAARHRLGAPYVVERTGPVEVRATDMTLDLEMRHEAELPVFLAALDREAAGLFTLSGCRLIRTGEGRQNEPPLARRRCIVPSSMAVRRPLRGGARLDARCRRPPGGRPRGRTGAMAAGPCRSAPRDLRTALHVPGGARGDRIGPVRPAGGYGTGRGPGRAPGPVRAAAAAAGPLGTRRRGWWPRSGRSVYAWIDGGRVAYGDSHPDRTDPESAELPEVRLDAGGRSIVVRPGQRFNPLTGAVIDPVRRPRGPVRTRPIPTRVVPRASHRFPHTRTELNSPARAANGVRTRGMGSRAPRTGWPRTGQPRVRGSVPRAAGSEGEGIGYETCRCEAAAKMRPAPGAFGARGARTPSGPLGSQRGAALLALVLALALGSGLVTIEWLEAAARASHAARRTEAALAAARDALIGYAVSYPDQHSGRHGPGYLPCPDTSGNGSPNTPCPAAALGRLPWRRLGLHDPRDGAGERLWYALDRRFRANGYKHRPLNGETAADLVVDGRGGVAAVILAPGPALPFQDRVRDRFDPAQYLEGGNETPGDGAYVSRIAPPARPHDRFNDRVAAISRDELMAAAAGASARRRPQDPRGVSRRSLEHGSPAVARALDRTRRGRAPPCPARRPAASPLSPHGSVLETSLRITGSLAGGVVSTSGTVSPADLGLPAHPLTVPAGHCVWTAVRQIDCIGESRTAPGPGPGAGVPVRAALHRRRHGRASRARRYPAARGARSRVGHGIADRGPRLRGEARRPGAGRSGSPRVHSRGR